MSKLSEEDRQYLKEHLSFIGAFIIAVAFTIWVIVPESMDTAIVPIIFLIGAVMLAIGIVRGLNKR